MIMAPKELDLFHKSVAYLVQRPTYKELDLTEDKEDKDMMKKLEGMRPIFRRNIIHSILRQLIVSHNNKEVA